MLLFALLPTNSALYAPAVATFPGQAAEGLWTETCSQPASQQCGVRQAVDVAREEAAGERGRMWQG
jgi:hypothetical protein